MPDFSVRHDHYKERDDIWKYNREHYAGGRTLVDSSKVTEYLVRFSLESPNAYDARKKRAKGWYSNLVKGSIGIYQSQIFRRDPERKLPEALKMLQGNVDLNETNAGPFFEDVTSWAQRQGLSYVFVDSPEVPGQLTERGRIERNLRPWFEHLHASQVVDWDVEAEDPERRGQLKYAVIYDTVTREKEPFMLRKPSERYRVWTPESWEIWETPPGGGDPARRDAGPNSIGVVPLVPFYDHRTAPMQGETNMDDVSLAANALWNAASVRDEAFQYQGFNQLVLTTDTPLDELKLGEARAIRLPLGSSAQYLAPSAIPFEAYRQLVFEVTERVGDLVFARTSRQVPTKQVESAEKKDLDRQEFVALLNRKSSNFQDAEKQCWVLMAMYYGLEKEKAEQEIEIKYNREFRVNERSMAEWIQGIRESIFSREEAYMAYHPGVDEDSAKKKVEENITVEQKRNPIFQAAKELGAPDVGDPDEELDNNAVSKNRPPLRAVGGGQE
jgi:hypothetical protein